MTNAAPRRGLAPLPHLTLEPTLSLSSPLPWLRRYKDWLIDRVRINKYKSAFLWDVQVTGGDRKMIEAKMMEYARPPEPGSVLVHNESEIWKAVQPRSRPTTSPPTARRSRSWSPWAPASRSTTSRKAAT